MHDEKLSYEHRKEARWLTMSKWRTAGSTRARTRRCEFRSSTTIDADAYVVRPGPRLVDGLELLAWIIAGAEGDPPHPHAVTRVS
jgi:hypothetical protein